MTRTYHPEFLTATILNWQHLLADDKLKQQVVDSFEWLVMEKRCSIYAFVIMPNHIHLLWRIADGFERQMVQGALFSYTGHAFQKYLRDTNPGILNKHYVNDADRTYQFWERNPLPKECITDGFLTQKLEYIHNNPCQPHWQLSKFPEQYHWSSASFYERGDKRFSWLKHFDE
jgi:putative transposase